jgi:hypothetical protein
MFAKIKKGFAVFRTTGRVSITAALAILGGK